MMGPFCPFTTVQNLYGPKLLTWQLTFHHMLTHTRIHTYSTSQNVYTASTVVLQGKRHLPRFFPSIEGTLEIRIHLSNREHMG